MKRLSFFIAIICITISSCSQQENPVLVECIEEEHSSNQEGSIQPDREPIYLCEEFWISGTVYIDADSNGLKDPIAELGIANVTVSLTDDKGNFQTDITDDNGYFEFLKTAGTFTLRIEAATPADDFNEELAESFNATSPTSIDVKVGPDSPGNDFGFDPKAVEITTEIEEDVLLTNGEPVKFWEKQLQAVIHDSKGKREFDTATLTEFLLEIQALFLYDPFQFTPGNEFQEAYDILSTNSKDPLIELLRELLAAEFNEVSGKGLINAEDLQSVLISWAESLVVEALSGSSLSTKYFFTPQGSTGSSNLREATLLLFRINGSTGGGGGGEG